MTEVSNKNLKKVNGGFEQGYYDFDEASGGNE